MKQRILIVLLAFLMLPSASLRAGNDVPPAAVPAIVQTGALPIIGVDEVKAGQKGYGLSVFAGTQPERFEVEVIGVWRNTTSPETSYILARLTGHGLERMGVASGMSGSPVFLDGRLAGAVAFSWPFSHEAIAGVTPIESMRRLSGLRGGMAIATPPPPVDLASLLAGRIPKDLLERELSRLQPKLVAGAQPSVQWVTTGFGEMSQGVLRRAFGSTTAAGRMAPGSGPKELALGSSVAAVLVDGDLQLAVTGTVTDRYGDDVLAFGHPFLGMGPIQVPMATAEILTVLSSQYASFKIANVGEIVGAFEQDRQAGIQGRMGRTAPMTPMVVRIAADGGGKPREFHLRLAAVPLFTPMLIGSSVLASVESASYTSGPQSLDLAARFRVRGHGDLTVRQSFDGDSAVTEVATFVLSLAAYLVNNPLEQVSIDGVEVDVQQSPQPRTATLVGANAERTVVRPGERVGLNLDLVAWRGERFRRTLNVDLPEDLPAGRYSLLVGDGASMDAARLAMEPAAPVTFEQAFELLRSLHSRRDLVALGVYSGPGLSVAGEVMPRLPASVRSLWGAAPSGSATPLRSTIAQEVGTTMEMPLDGAVRIDLEVRRREPVSAAEHPAAAPGGTPGTAGPAAPAKTQGGKKDR